jgi:hypothetical protein
MSGSGTQKKFWYLDQRLSFRSIYRSLLEPQAIVAIQSRRARQEMGRLTL